MDISTHKNFIASFVPRMLKEFKEFLIKGNAVDLAIWFIFGWAFATVIKSMVDNVIMPPLGMLMNGVDFSDLYFSLDGNRYASLEEAVKAGAPAIKYGQFVNDVVAFLILGFVIFLFVKWYNRLKSPVKAEPKTKACQYCLMDIPRKATVCGYCTKNVA